MVRIGDDSFDGNQSLIPHLSGKSFILSDLNVSQNDTSMAYGILNDWQRRNLDIKKELKAVQHDLKADLSMYSNLNSSNVSSDQLLELKGSDPRKQLEIENKLLMDIVAQVRADLQKANLTSPSSLDERKSS